MAERSSPSGRRELLLKSKQQQFSPKTRKRVLIGLILTILAAGVLFLMDFGFLLIPKDADRLTDCTLVSMEYASGRPGNWYSVFQDHAGGQYTITASRQDYIGREVSLYTGAYSAYRTHYELPRDYVWHVIGYGAILMLMGLEIWYFVKYLEYRKRYAPLILRAIANRNNTICSRRRRRRAAFYAA